MIPNLEPHSGSWVVTRKADGAVIGEFFNRASVERFNLDKCHVQTIAQHLSGLNAQRPQ